MRQLCAAVVMLLAAIPGLGQWVSDGDLAHSALPIAAKAGEELCPGGVQRDDGSIETGYRIPFEADSRFVQLLTPQVYPALLSRICVCWNNQNGFETMAYTMLVYDDNGPSGQPGTLLGSKGSIASFDVGNVRWFTQECSDLNVNVASGSVYVGAQWNAASNIHFFLCADQSPATPPASMYMSSNGGTSWSQVAFTFPNARALGLRSVFTPTGPAPTCTPDADTLCLNNGRFKVEAAYQTAQVSGAAQVVKLTDETGYLWFFNANNVESVVKVLNACGVNGRYWVFAAGLTNQGMNITITDTLHPTSVKHYTNPLDTTFVTKTDTDAFATCP